MNKILVIGAISIILLLVFSLSGCVFNPNQGQGINDPTTVTNSGTTGTNGIDNKTIVTATGDLQINTTDRTMPPPLPEE